MAGGAKDTVKEEALAGFMGASDTCTRSFLSTFNTLGGRVLDILVGAAACAGSAWDILAKGTPGILTGKLFFSLLLPPRQYLGHTLTSTSPPRTYTVFAQTVSEFL